MGLDLLVIGSLPYGLLISAPTSVEMCACFNMYHEAVTIRNHGNTEVLNAVNEPGIWDRSDDELPTESESDIGKDSGVCTNLKRVSIYNH